MPVFKHFPKCFYEDSTRNSIPGFWYAWIWYGFAHFLWHLIQDRLHNLRGSLKTEMQRFLFKNWKFKMATAESCSNHEVCIISKHSHEAGHVLLRSASHVSCTSLHRKRPRLWSFTYGLMEIYQRNPDSSSFSTSKIALEVPLIQHFYTQRRQVDCDAELELSVERHRQYIIKYTQMP